jgi:antitoxin MazE
MMKAMFNHTAFVREKNYFGWHGAQLKHQYKYFHSSVLSDNIVRTIWGEHFMKVAIRAMGNSRGLLIPKPVLQQLGLTDAADLQVVNGVIEIRAIKQNPRETWAADSQRLAAQEDDGLVWPEFSNSNDKALAW